jgi:hypothetical protein
MSATSHGTEYHVLKFHMQMAVAAADYAQLLGAGLIDILRRKGHSDLEDIWLPPTKISWLEEFFASICTKPLPAKCKDKNLRINVYMYIYIYMHVCITHHAQAWLVQRNQADSLFSF